MDENLEIKAKSYGIEGCSHNYACGTSEPIKLTNPSDNPDRTFSAEVAYLSYCKMCGKVHYREEGGFSYWAWTTIKEIVNKRLEHGWILGSNGGE